MVLASKTAYIIGKGSSLTKLQPEHVKYGSVVIAMNKAIAEVEERLVGNSADIYSLQQDNDISTLCTPKRATLCLSEESAWFNPAYKKRLIVGPKRDAYFSALVALELAKSKGCTSVVFVSCDSLQTPSDLTYFNGQEDEYLKDRIFATKMYAYQLFGDNVYVKQDGIDKKIAYVPATVITPTGDRNEIFRLCRYYYARQSVFPTQWIIIDDGGNPMPSWMHMFTDYQHITRASMGCHTLRFNMLDAFPLVKNDMIIMVEDDDWYSPKYFERQIDTLMYSSMSGEANTIYYHVPGSRWLQNGNSLHSSWCETAFRKEMIPTISDICKATDRWDIDLLTWGSVRKAGEVRTIYNNEGLVIGLKGLPGRAGITSGHNINNKSYKPDTGRERLKSWIGEDVKYYDKYR